MGRLLLPKVLVCLGLWTTMGCGQESSNQVQEVGGVQASTQANEDRDWNEDPYDADMRAFRPDISKEDWRNMPESWKEELFKQYAKNAKERGVTHHPGEQKYISKKEGLYGLPGWRLEKMLKDGEITQEQFNRTKHGPTHRLPHPDAPRKYIIFEKSLAYRVTGIREYLGDTPSLAYGLLTNRRLNMHKAMERLRGYLIQALTNSNRSEEFFLERGRVIEIGVRYGVLTPQGRYADWVKKWTNWQEWDPVDMVPHLDRAIEAIPEGLID